tara:strand:+ start:255 stop:542 length:288 start_codon:yes stop_codon:yes gene_type:complete
MNRQEIILNLVFSNTRHKVKYEINENGQGQLCEKSQGIVLKEFEEIENMFLHLEYAQNVGYVLSPEEIEEFYIDKVMPYDKRSMAEIIEEYMGAN